MLGLFCGLVCTRDGAEKWVRGWTVEASIAGAQVRF